MGGPTEGLLPCEVLSYSDLGKDVNARELYSIRKIWPWPEPHSEGKLGGNFSACQSLQTKPETRPTDSMFPPTTAQYGSLNSDVAKKRTLVQQ